MDIETLERCLQEDEGVSLEFKRCGNRPGRDVFETVCAFANRQGGSILLGVTDDGLVEGVVPAEVLGIERNLANVTSDLGQFSSAPLVEFESVDVGGRAVIRVWVPMGPSVYRFKGVAFDRIADADLQVRGDAEIAALHIRKQGTYTERRVIPWMAASDLSAQALARSRELIAARNPGHPWLSPTDDELIHREYTSPSVATLSVTDGGIRTRSASRALFAGRVTLEDLDPTPKNPTIANFFTQLGRSEELGGGTRAIYDHALPYGGREAVREEGNFFEAFVAGPASTSTRTDDPVLGCVAAHGPVSAPQVSEALGIPPRTVRRRLHGLVERGLPIAEGSAGYALPPCGWGRKVSGGLPLRVP